MSNSAATMAAKRRHAQPSQQSRQSRLSQQSQQSQQSNSNKQNVVFEKQPENNTRTEEISQQQPTQRLTAIQLLKRHDYKLFCLEKLLTSNNALNNASNNASNNDFVTKSDLENLQLDSSISSKLDNKIINKIDNNESELITLKNTVTALNKSMESANSLITIMKATLLSQANEIKELKEGYDILCQAVADEENNENIEEYTEKVSEEATKNIELEISNA